MNSEDLGLYTSEELVSELLRRQTFMGVLVRGEGDWKGRWDGVRNFKVSFNDNLDTEEVRRLLGVVAEHLPCHD